ncbi:MAG: hypothetical protein J0H93_00275 [Chlamydiales bacterium]|nr:hypothetical protein [Chlamydiales bacterium]
MASHASIVSSVRRIAFPIQGLSNFFETLVHVLAAWQKSVGDWMGSELLTGLE